MNDKRIGLGVFALVLVALIASLVFGLNGQRALAETALEVALCLGLGYLILLSFSKP